jgi:hypothetical protein
MSDRSLGQADVSFGLELEDAPEELGQETREKASLELAAPIELAT